MTYEIVYQNNDYISILVPAAELTNIPRVHTDEFGEDYYVLGYYEDGVYHTLPESALEPAIDVPYKRDKKRLYIGVGAVLLTIVIAVLFLS